MSEVHHRCYKCPGSWYESWWCVFLQKTEHPTLKLGIAVPSRLLPKVCIGGRRFSISWRTSECSRPCMAMDSSRAGGDHSASQTSPVRLDARTLSPPGGNSLSPPGASEYLENASMQGRVADGKSARGHDLGTSHLNIPDNPSNDMKRKPIRATRRSTNNLPETMLANAEMNSVGTVTRHSYTTAHDALVVWAKTHELHLDADHATLDRVLVRYLDEELFAKGGSAGAARLAMFGTICCRGVPRHPHISTACWTNLQALRL